MLLPRSLIIQLTKSESWWDLWWQLTKAGTCWCTYASHSLMLHLTNTSSINEGPWGLDTAWTLMIGACGCIYLLLLWFCHSILKQIYEPPVRRQQPCICCLTPFWDQQLVFVLLGLLLRKLCTYHLELHPCTYHLELHPVKLNCTPSEPRALKAWTQWHLQRFISFTFWQYLPCWVKSQTLW